MRISDWSSDVCSSDLVLQSASAAFTPTFQATIPDILPEERDYTRALSLSRLAYDMESLTSPILAAGLLTVINFHWLFSGTAIGFLCSALLVVTTVLPRAAKSEPRTGGIYAKTTRGTRIYLKTPRLRRTEELQSLMRISYAVFCLK